MINQINIVSYQQLQKFSYHKLNNVKLCSFDSTINNKNNNNFYSFSTEVPKVDAHIMEEVKE